LPWGARVFRNASSATCPRTNCGAASSKTIMAIGNYIDQHNQNPKPFIWTAKASDILEKVTRAQASLDKRLSV
jgi:hypothetical protein